MLPRRLSFSFFWLLLALCTVALSSCASRPVRVAPTPLEPQEEPAVTQTIAPGVVSAPAIHWPTESWTRAAPEERELDPEQLSALLEAVPQRAPSLTSLLVVRGGDIVLEKYFGASTADTRHEIYSCTKSFIATLVGIAIDQDYISGVDRGVLDFFPGWAVANLDPGKEALTLENLLTMTAGLDWTEGDQAYLEITRSQDWVQWMLDRPVIEPPGSRFNYCSGCSHVLSAILEKATGMNTFRFARKVLFQPLGIVMVEWFNDSKGTTSGGWGLQLTTRDMAKLGYLYLREGAWDDQQVVSREWIEQAVSAHVKAEAGLSYGYQWWMRPSMPGYAALGRNGQMIAVIPEKELVVVFTSDHEEKDQLFDLIDAYILPAAR